MYYLQANQQHLVVIAALSQADLKFSLRDKEKVWTRDSCGAAHVLTLFIALPRMKWLHKPRECTYSDIEDVASQGQLG